MEGENGNGRDNGNDRCPRLSGGTVRWSNVRWLVTALAFLLAAGCSGAAAPSPSTKPAPTSSTGPGVPLIEASVIGGSGLPRFTVQAPAPWNTDGQFVRNHTEGVFRGISVWDVARVPRNPCHPLGNSREPGPTVGDLVAALTAQRMRDATTPADVTLGGYSGRYLRWSVPAHMVVTGDSSFAGCTVEPGGRREFTSWYDSGDGVRWQQMAGQVDRLWVLDVNGQRLLIDATYSPNATHAQREEENRIVESIRFIPAT